MPPDRREFLKNASIASAAVVAGSYGSSAASAQGTTGNLIKMVQTPVLDIAYEEHGDSEAVTIILLHGHSRAT